MKRAWIPLLTTLLLGGAGCACCHRRPTPPPMPRPTVPCPTQQCPPGGSFVPAPVPVAPGGGAPPTAFGAPGGTVNPPPPPPAFGGAPSISPAPSRSAPFESNWQPAEARVPARSVNPGVQLSGPEPIPDDPLKGRTDPPPAAPEQRYRPMPEPPVAERPAPGRLPVGIPQFDEVQQGVASGLRPLLEGLDWLQGQGYHTVLHLRAPGEDDSADRKQVEKRGMTYLSMKISPEGLTRAKLDDFRTLVTERARQPIFVYDRDGALAGPLWYSYFRSIGQTEAQARERAHALGLREDGSDAHRAIWDAVRRVLGGV